MGEIQAVLVAPVPALARCLESGMTAQPGQGATLRAMRAQADGEDWLLGLGASPRRAPGL